MKWASVLLCVAIVAGVWAEEAAPEVPSDVTILTDSSIDTAKSGVWLVEFYAPWCGHCKRLAPAWEQLAQSMKGKFGVAKVDCTVEKEACKAFDVKGFPTIKLFKNGEVVPYSGPRTVLSFTKFVESNTALTGLVDALPEALRTQPDPPKPSQEEMAKREALRKEAAAKDAAATQDAVPANTDSDVVVLTNANFAEKSSTGTWLIEFYAPWCGHCKRLTPIWEELATQAKGKFNVAKVDCTVEKDIATQIGVKGFPTIKLFHNGKITDYKGPRTTEEFTKFVEANTA